jgi:calcineurin-like phosphoesterase family protein
MLIHNPDSSYTFDFSGWIIHGHHANYLEKYPLININEEVDVSVEVLNYKPISLEKS